MSTTVLGIVIVVTFWWFQSWFVANWKDLPPDERPKQMAVRVALAASFIFMWSLPAGGWSWLPYSVPVMFLFLAGLYYFYRQTQE